MKNYLILFILIFGMIGCKTTVNLTVKNPTDKIQDVKVSVIDKIGIVKTEIPLGTVDINKSISHSFKVKPKRKIECSSRINNYLVWKSSQRIVTSDDPNNIDFDIVMGPKEINGEEGINLIMDNFSQIGKNYGLLPIQVNQAVSTYLGALILIIPPTETDTEGKFLFRIPPSVFLNIPNDARPVIFPDTLSQNNVQILGSFAAKLALTFPILKFSAGYKNESLYNLNWEMRGFGKILVTEPNGWTLFNAIKNIPEDQKKIIIELMSQNQSAVLLYVNSIYAIRNGSIKRKEGQKTNSESLLGSGTFFAADAVWSFEQSISNEQSFSDAVLNIGGEIVQPIFIRPIVNPIDSKKWTTFSTKIKSEILKLSSVRKPKNEINLTLKMIEDSAIK